MNHFLTFVVVSAALVAFLTGIWRLWDKRLQYREDAFFATVLTVAGIVVTSVILYEIWMATA